MSISLLVAGLFCALSQLAASEVPIVRGKINTPNHDVVQGLYVSLEDATTHARTAHVDVRIDGSFEFRGLSTGDYTLHVTDDSGQPVWEQPVTIQMPMPEVEVRLPDRESGRGSSKASTVSLTELAHPPDKKAVKAFQSALHFADTWKYQDAASELEKAIGISPEFAEAHTNLELQYFRLGRYEESAAESARAIQISGPQARNLCNLATAQARLQRFEEAEKSARAALRLDSRLLQANLILGFILVDDPLTRTEGLKHLQKAAPAFTSARLFLERLQAGR
jgi:tetratricopeptide (TPR) repeat protein